MVWWLLALCCWIAVACGTPLPASHALVLCLVLWTSRLGTAQLLSPSVTPKRGGRSGDARGWAAARGQWVWEARSIALSGRPVDAACRYRELLQRGRHRLCASSSGSVRRSEALLDLLIPLETEMLLRTSMSLF